MQPARLCEPVRCLKIARDAQCLADKYQVGIADNMLVGLLDDGKHRRVFVVVISQCRESISGNNLMLPIAGLAWQYHRTIEYRHRGGRNGNTVLPAAVIGKSNKQPVELKCVARRNFDACLKLSYGCATSHRSTGEFVMALGTEFPAIRIVSPTRSKGWGC